MSDKLKILIPTDFSVQADYAFLMVKNLERKASLEVTFLHVLNVPDTVSIDANGMIETCGEIDNEYVISQKNIAEQKLNSIKMIHGNHIHTALVYGKTTHEIIDYAEQNQFDLIVMGTKGLSGLRERIAGSEAQIIARKSSVPLLTLMCDRSDLEIQHLLLVHNFNDTHKQDLSLMKKFSVIFGAKLHLLQITNKPIDSVRGEIEANMEKFARINEVEDYEMHIVKDSDIEAGVIHFNQMSNMDIVCIGTHGKGGFFHTSAAEKLVNHMYKPIITFHLN